RGIGRMPALLEDGTECPDGQGEALRRAFWFHIRSAWGDPGAASAGTYTVPGQPLFWRGQDPYFKDSYETLARADEARALEQVRAGALRGEPWALRLCYRSSRGAARPVNADPRNRWQEPEVKPHVAAAMIKAGLRAAGRECYEDRYPEETGPAQPSS